MKKFRILAIIQILFATGILGYWIIFYVSVFSAKLPNPGLEICYHPPISGECLKRVVMHERYLSFEKAFPLPDLGWVTPLLLIGANGLLKNRRYGYLASLLAGAALMFLGLVDISFNLQNERYTFDLTEGLMNGFINLACAIFGPVLIILTSKELRFK